MRVFPLRLFFLLLTPGLPAAPPDGLDVNGLDAPLVPGPFSIVRFAEVKSEGDVHLGLRTSVLLRPLSVRVPSPSLTGYAASVVDGVFLTELSSSVALPMGFDLGVGFGAHVYQWGAGAEVTQGAASTLPSFGVTDPRFEGGYNAKVGPLTLRPFLAFTLPLGRPDAFSGEPYSRLQTGVSLCHDAGTVIYGVETNFLYRPLYPFSNATWGPQLHFSAAVLYRPVRWLAFGPELLVSPVLSQGKSGDGESMSLLVPGEALGTVRYLGDGFAVGALVGSGIPLTRAPLAGEGLVRGPTSPTLRAGIDLRFTR